MGHKGAFCFSCCEKRTFCVRSTREEITIRGITFSYIEKRAYCIECGEEVYVPEISDENCDRRNEAFILAYERRYGKRPKGMEGVNNER